MSHNFTTREFVIDINLVDHTSRVGGHLVPLLSSRVRNLRQSYLRSGPNSSAHNIVVMYKGSNIVNPHADGRILVECIAVDGHHRIEALKSLSSQEPWKTSIKTWPVKLVTIGDKESTLTDAEINMF